MTTPSLPIRFYERVPSSDLVSFCLSEPWASLATERHYRTSGYDDTCADGLEALLKRIVTRAGDTVVETRDGVYINHCLIRNSKPLALDGKKRPLEPFVVGAYELKTGEVWVMGEHSKSFDSRYYGPIKVSNIRSYRKKGSYGTRGKKTLYFALLCAVLCAIGVGVHMGNPWLVVLSVIPPCAFVTRDSRGDSFVASLFYYAGVLSVLPAAVSSFFPSQNNWYFLLYPVGILILASPWALVWGKTHSSWRCVIGVVPGIIPPLGVIGWVSPIFAAGWLFLESAGSWGPFSFCFFFVMALGC